MSGSAAIRIRPGRRDDAAAVGALAAEFADYLRALGDPTDFRFDAGAFLRDGFGPRAAFRSLVATRAGALVGYLLWHDGYDTDRAVRLVHVVDLYVVPRCRGAGVGRRLMTVAAERARARGAGELQWAVYLPNRPAFAFYEALGGKSIDDLAFMRLPLERDSRTGG